MKTDSEPNQKLPWQPEFFASYIQNYDLSQNFYFICLCLTMVFSESQSC